jgi:hypothetical protein
MQPWVQKMMSTSPLTEEKKNEGKPEVKKKEVKSEVKQEPITPVQTFSSSSITIARRTRKATEAEKILVPKMSSDLLTKQNKNGEGVSYHLLRSSPSCRLRRRSEIVSCCQN